MGSKLICIGISFHHKELTDYARHINGCYRNLISNPIPIPHTELRKINKGTLALAIL